MTLTKSELDARKWNGKTDEQPWNAKITDVLLVWAPGGKLVGLYETTDTYDHETQERRDPAALARAHAKRVKGKVMAVCALKQAHFLGRTQWFVLPPELKIVELTESEP